MMSMSIRLTQRHRDGKTVALWVVCSLDVAMLSFFSSRFKGLLRAPMAENELKASSVFLTVKTVRERSSCQAANT